MRVSLRFADPLQGFRHRVRSGSESQSQPLTAS